MNHNSFKYRGYTVTLDNDTWDVRRGNSALLATFESVVEAYTWIDNRVESEREIVDWLQAT